jgi:hypothetical protein
VQEGAENGRSGRVYYPAATGKGDNAARAVPNSPSSLLSEFPDVTHLHEVRSPAAVVDVCPGLSLLHFRSDVHALSGKRKETAHGRSNCDFRWHEKMSKGYVGGRCHDGTVRLRGCVGSGSFVDCRSSMASGALFRSVSGFKARVA